MSGLSPGHGHVTPRPCCDLHGRNCELDDPCCTGCTEVRHLNWTDGHGNWRFGHPLGETCSNPVLSVAALSGPAEDVPGAT